MSVLEKINEEIKNAMRSKDSFRLNALKYIKSLIQNNNIDKSTSSELDVVMGHHKKMVKATEMYKDKALEDLKKEISIIEEFLPKSLSEDEISQLVDKHISLGNMGAIMKALKEEITGPFDGKLVSALIKSKLS